MKQTREMRIIGRNFELSFYVDEIDYKTLRLWEYKWTRLIGHTTTYIKTEKNGKTIYLHRLIMGCSDKPRSVCVDHIDRNGLNNYKANLRITDNSGNNANTPKRLSAKYTSSYKGVSKIPNNKSKCWQARIKLSGKEKHLGFYRTETEAARAYNQAALDLFGPIAYLNIIEPNNKK